MKATVGRISALALLIFKDGIRRRALLGLLILALFIELGGLFFFGFVPRDIGRVLSDYVVTIGWAAGVLYLLFHAVQVMSWGDDRRVIQLFLAHPLSRYEYVGGLFVGLFSLLLLLNAVLAGASFAVLVCIKFIVGKAFFAHLGLAEYLLAWCGAFCVQLALLSVIALFSGLVRGGFGVLLLTVAYYLICNGLPIARDFFSGTSVIGTYLLTALTFFFPDFSRWDYKGAIAVLGAFPPFSSLLFDFVFIAVYCLLTLILAARIYRSRDIK